MKITLELPEELGRKFKATIPNGKRSKLVAELLSQRLKSAERTLESAARKANKFKALNADMKAWEAFNGSDPDSGLRSTCIKTGQAL
jgi:hypothetical protein